MEMRKLPISPWRLPQGWLFNRDGTITHVFDDTQLLPGRWTQVKKWWRESKCRGKFPESQGHCQVKRGRFDIPHHGQWMYKQGQGIAYDDGTRRVIYDKRFNYVKTVNSDHLKPKAIYEMCGMPLYGEKGFVHLQGVAYTKRTIYCVFGDKGREMISIFKCDREKRLVMECLGIPFDDIKLPFVKNWEAENIEINPKDGSIWIGISFKAYFGFRWNRIVKVDI